MTTLRSSWVQFFVSLWSTSNDSVKPVRALMERVISPDCDNIIVTLILSQILTRSVVMARRSVWSKGNSLWRKVSVEKPLREEVLEHFCGSCELQFCDYLSPLASIPSIPTLFPSTPIVTVRKIAELTSNLLHTVTALVRWISLDITRYHPPDIIQHSIPSPLSSAVS